MSKRTLVFASPEWNKKLAELAEGLLRAPGVDLGDITFALTEKFTGVPEDVAPGGTSGWYVRVRSGKVDSGTTPLDQAELKITADWATTHADAVKIVPTDPTPEERAEQEKAQAALVETGKVKYEATIEMPPAMARALASLHNDIASLTLEPS